MPQSWVAKKGNAKKNPVIGVWSTTSKKSANGKYQQVSRLGNPLVNEVVIPLKVKDAFNASKPTQDVAALKYVTNPELPKLIEAVYGIEAPKTPRNDLVSVFLTGVEGLNKPKGKITPERAAAPQHVAPRSPPSPTGSASSAATTRASRTAAGSVTTSSTSRCRSSRASSSAAPNDLGDGVDANDVAFGDTFPYLALPASGSDADPHPVRGRPRPSSRASTGRPAAAHRAEPQHSMAVRSVWGSSP